MYGEILKSYGQVFKFGFLTAIVLSIMAYGAYLRWQVWMYEQEISSLKSVAGTFTEEKIQLESALKTQESIIKSLEKYYAERRPLNLRNGELSPDEILPSYKEKVHDHENKNP